MTSAMKYKLYKTIDFVSHNKTKCLRSYSTSIKYDYDILNLDNKEWFHPVTKEKHNESFINLMEKAKKETIKAINSVLNYINNDKNINLKDILPDIDYSSGLLIKDNKKMRHFEY